MNKLLIFPMAFMFILTIFSVIYTGETLQGESEDYGDPGSIIINEETGEVDIPEAEHQEFNIWDSTGAMVILFAAIAIAIIAGIKILGSGLSDMSQSLIFDGILFLGLWACLTIVSSEFLFQTSMSILLWVSLTTIYIIGMGLHMSGSAGDI